jgi:O-antigen/teichoic acid export membrane protein
MIAFIKKKIHNLISDKKFSEILTGSVWALGAKVLAAVLGLITTVIIARFYGPEVLGIMAVLQSFLLLTTIFTVLGTNTSILRLIPEHLAKYSPSSAFKVYRKTQYLVLGTSLVTGCLMFFGSGFIAETIFSKPHFKPYFALAAVFIIFKSLMLLNQQAVRGLRMIKVFALMHLLPQLSKLLILTPLTIYFFHQDNPIYALMASFALTALMGAWIMDRAFKQKSTPQDSLQPMPMKDILSLSLPMFMTATMNLIIGQTGLIMVGIFRPEAEVGYYAVAVKLATLTAFILHAVNSMAAPKFSELYNSDKINELFYVARKSAKLIFWTTTPILLVFVILGKPILLVFGPEFVVAYLPLVLLVSGKFVSAVSGATGIFMNMTGHQNMLRNIIFIATLSNVGLNLLLTPEYGTHGAAFSAMISIAGWNIATLAYIKLKFGRTTGYFPKLV